ncbi:hypothetical protein HG531_012451 [Fusarium graminearum]|nr:hypothetical protein HG531_012451 [Fusarium graminearum]
MDTCVAAEVRWLQPSISGGRAAVEQTTLFQLFNSLVDKLIFIYDTQCKGTQDTHEKGEGREEEEEAEDIQVALATIRSCLGEQTSSRLAQPHGTQAETSNRRSQRQTSVSALSKVLCARRHSGHVKTASRHTDKDKRQHQEGKRPVVIDPIFRMTTILKIQLPVNTRREAIAATKQDSSRQRKRL